MNRTDTPHSAARLLLVAALATTLAGAALALAWAPLVTLGRALRPGGGVAADAAPPTELLSGCAAAVLLACTVWLWTGGLISLTRLALGLGTSRARGVPPVAHRVVLAACGLATAGLGVAAPAGAVPTPVHEEPRVVPLAAQPTPQAAARHAWRVRAGDTLWAVAETTLARAGVRTSDAAVAQRVRAVHRLNRAAVPDPDLIHPGQLLRLPRS